MSKAKTPIILITGALGSGKTTLLKDIMSNSSRRLAILMNEFGEIGIDSKIVKGNNIEIKELAGGCVCCSMTGEFEAAVREIIETIHPELIILEATGVAEADALVYEVEDNISQVRLDTIIYIVDAYTTLQFPQIGYVTAKQIEVADILLINKMDLAAATDIQKIEQQSRRYNKSALILKTQYGRIDADLIFDPQIKRLRNWDNREKQSPHTLLPHIESFSFDSGKIFDKLKFEEVVKTLPQNVYRAKGFIKFSTGFELFNYVLGRSSYENFAADKTELVFIGPHLKSHKETVIQRLKDCEQG